MAVRQRAGEERSGGADTINYLQSLTITHHHSQSPKIIYNHLQSFTIICNHLQSVPDIIIYNPPGRPARADNH
jgi:hypothetical protein